MLTSAGARCKQLAAARQPTRVRQDGRYPPLTRPPPRRRLPPRLQVCSSACPAADATCKPLAAFRLRLADAVLAKPASFIKLANPEGAVAATCAPAGPGWFVRGAELLSLTTGNPAEVSRPRSVVQRAGPALSGMLCRLHAWSAHHLPLPVHPSWLPPASRLPAHAYRDSLV